MSAIARLLGPRFVASGECPAPPAPSGRLGSRFALACAALACTALLAAPAPATAANTAPADTSFWARYLALAEAFDSRPDGARAALAARFAADSQDVLAHWAYASRVLASDSAATRARVELARAAAEDPGLQFEAALLLVPRSAADGWAALDRARDAYARAGRPRSAAQAMLLVVLRTDMRQVALRERRYAEAESLARSAGNPLDALTIRLRAVQDFSDRSGEESLPRFEAVLAEADTGPPSAVRADAHHQYAITLKNLGRLDEAEVQYRIARDLAGRAGSEVVATRAWLGQTGLLKARGDVRAAVAEERRILAHTRQTGNQLLQGLVLTGIGVSELALHHLDASGAALREALALFESRGSNFDTRVTLLDQLGGVHALSGRPDSASRCFDAALAIARARGYRHREAFVLQHMAEFALDQGRLEDAWRLNEESLKAARESGRRRVEEVGLAQGAAILLEQGQRAGAADMALAGARMTREGEPRNYGNAVQFAVAVLAEVGRAGDGLALVDSLRDFLAAHPDSLGSALADGMEASLRLAGGDAAGAAALAARELAQLEALAAPDRVAAARLALGTALLAAGRDGEAAEAIERGLPWFENSLAGSRSSEERITTQTRWQDAYVDLAVAYVRLGKPGRAFTLMDRSRARELRQALAQVRGLRERPASPDAHDLGAIEDELSETQARLFAQYARPVRQRDPALRRWEARADSLRARWRETRRRVQRDAPADAATTGLADPLEAADARGRLRPGERLLAFFTGRRHALLFDLTPARLEVHELPWTDRELEPGVEAWLRELRAGSGEAWRARAAQLADSLLGACRLERGSEQRLYVVPDGILHRLPFEALLVPAAGGGRQPLIARSEVVYASSPSVLLRGGDASAGRSLATASLAAFGDPGGAAPPARAAGALVRGTGAPGDSAERAAPMFAALPNARREVEGLRTLYPGSRIYLGAAANERAFLSELGRSRMLHVAAHGFADDRHPEFSGVVLAPGRDERGRTEDGVVQAWELPEARGRLDLVTLSACETGSGLALHGEGLLGLSRAFTIAGARQLVVSLWKVDDAASADLMLAFYAGLRRGQAPAAALRAAKLAFLAGADAPAPPGTPRGVGVQPDAVVRAHPAAWAAFVLQASRQR